MKTPKIFNLITCIFYFNSFIKTQFDFNYYFLLFLNITQYSYNQKNKKEQLKKIQHDERYKIDSIFWKIPTLKIE